MISVAVAALRSEGIGDPQAHLYLAVTDNLATLIISRAPFNTADLATLTATVELAAVHGYHASGDAACFLSHGGNP